MPCLTGDMHADACETVEVADLVASVNALVGKKVLVGGHVLVMYCFVLGIAESTICIEQQIMFLCDCKCSVHLTQLSIS